MVVFNFNEKINLEIKKEDGNKAKAKFSMVKSTLNDAHIEKVVKEIVDLFAYKDGKDKELFEHKMFRRFPFITSEYENIQQWENFSDSDYYEIIKDINGEIGKCNIVAKTVRDFEFGDELIPYWGSDLDKTKIGYIDQLRKMINHLKTKEKEVFNVELNNLLINENNSDEIKRKFDFKQISAIRNNKDLYFNFNVNQANTETLGDLILKASFISYIIGNILNCENIQINLNVLYLNIETNEETLNSDKVNLFINSNIFEKIEDVGVYDLKLNIE